MMAVRILQLLFLRVAPPDPAQRERLGAKLAARFPTGHAALDLEIARLLMYLQVPQATAELVAALEAAPTQEMQIDYAAILRFQRAGWNDDLRRRYFAWFGRAATFRGGMSFRLFVESIRKDAEAGVPDALRPRIREWIGRVAETTRAPRMAKPRPFVRRWRLADLAPLIESNLAGAQFERGKRLFSEALCFHCHRLGGEGGAVGPDLTGAGRRFSLRDLVESIVDPSKTVSDQYAATAFQLSDGRVVTGRVVNLSGDEIWVGTDMLAPSKITKINRNQIEATAVSPTSMMPAGLLDTLHQDEIRDLLAYLVSGGDPKHPVFGK
ncbi:MAG TPA: c-type cytochrome [Bryobacterales bacterium]|nr:c-type cytochrome [Bryobacterales bacterium]